MKVLLSIKPVYAEKIFSGQKQFEFRRTIFKDKRVSKVVVYASAPVQKVIGEFEIDQILNDEIESLWQKTKLQAGISYDFFASYFANKPVVMRSKLANVSCIKNHLV
jgi:predicted transcriptional regulator